MPRRLNKCICHTNSGILCKNNICYEGKQLNLCYIHMTSIKKESVAIIETAYINHMHFRKSVML